MIKPKDIQLIGDDLAIVWDDGSESYIRASKLRAASPSAETQGERDIFGQVHGKAPPRGYDDVEILGWNAVGNYAIRFRFSDGHQSGLYSFELLRELGVNP